MRRLLLVLVLATVMLVLVAASATAKQPKQYCTALGGPPFTPGTSTICGDTKQQCESRAEEIEQLSPGVNFPKCKRV